MHRETEKLTLYRSFYRINSFKIHKHDSSHAWIEPNPLFVLSETLFLCINTFLKYQIKNMHARNQNMHITRSTKINIFCFIV